MKKCPGCNSKDGVQEYLYGAPSEEPDPAVILESRGLSLLTLGLNSKFPAPQNLSSASVFIYPIKN
jgi:hypothetical protein